jgi:23S rRNA pseudouridine1911/1915/1917 synthase
VSAAHLVPPELDGRRAERIVATLWSMSTAAARRLCAAGHVRADGRRAAAGDRLLAGVEVVVAVATDGAARWFAAAPPVPVLFADADVIVVDKPAGRACHPLRPGEGGTVVDAVVAAYPEVAEAGPEPREGGLLHRLDNATSGCLAFARTAAAFARLAPALRDDDDGATPTTRMREADGGATKEYLAVVHGVVGTVGVELGIDDPVGHVPGDPRRMQVAHDGRPARTDVRVLGVGDGLSVLALTLHGGRRHQLRVHLAARGHAIVGDPLYASSSPPSSTPLLLHAWRLRLPGRPAVVAPVSAVWVDVLRRARLDDVVRAAASGDRGGPSR